MSIDNFLGTAPNRQQLAWQAMGMYAFIHFTVNTFTGREWGDGTEPEDIFNPTELNCDQWCKVISEAGFKGVVLTAKHHDGFCLWPSKYTKHSVASSKWRKGKGDVVGELAKSAKKFGLKLGLYLSPWDRHEKTYGSGEKYNRFYRNQLKELFETYGGKNGEDIFIAWFDGACGEGPNGKVQVYDYDGCVKVIRKYAPNAAIFGQMGDHRDIRWCGNESGYAGNPNWATMNTYVDANHNHDLQHGVPNGKFWWPSEVDVSIRPGWFYHAAEDSRVRSLESLLDIFYNSVGRGSCLHLNFPPDQRGLIHENDVARVQEWKLVLDKTFAEDFCDGAESMSSSEWEVTVEFGKKRLLNIIRLSEDTRFGQRVAAFKVDFRNEKGEWELLAEDQTISFSKLLRTKAVKTDAIKVTVLEALDVPYLQELGAYYQPPLLFAPQIARDCDGNITLSSSQNVDMYYTLDGSAPNKKSEKYTGPIKAAEAGTIRAVAVLPKGVKNSWPEIKSKPESMLRFGIAGKGIKVIREKSRIGVDTGKKRPVSGFILTEGQRMMGASGAYKFYAGKQLVAEGNFDNIHNNPIPQIVEFKQPVEARTCYLEAVDSNRSAENAKIMLEVF